MTIAGGVAGIELMENAGRAVADRVSARHPPGRPRRRRCRAGQQRRRWLCRRPHSRRARIPRAPAIWSANIERIAGDARLAAQRWQGPCTPAAPAALMPADVVIDALFGAGLDRAVEGVARAMIEAMNAAPCVHAVDLPSGINGTSGAVMGLAVNATDTVTFFRRKAAMCCCPAGCIAEPIHVADIGIAGERARQDQAADSGSTVRSCGPTASRCRRSTGTNMLAATPSWYPAGSPRPARRALPPAARCARALGS